MRFKVGLVYFLNILVITIFSFPIYWMLSTALKPKAEWFTSPPHYLPMALTYENFINVLTPGYTGGAFYPLINSLQVSLISTALVTVISLFAAYSLAIYERENLSFFILTFRMMPPISSVIPIFLIMRWLGLLDTVYALILVYTMFNLPFAVWVMKGFLAEIPRELVDAAYVDGCTVTQSLLKIVLPLAAPGIAVTALFSFIFSWNEFLFALMLTRVNGVTIPVHISGLFILKGVAWGEISALGSIVCLPVMALAAVLQKYIVRGLTFGAIKA